jgi:hypothetical protein
MAKGHPRQCLGWPFVLYSGSLTLPLNLINQLEQGMALEINQEAILGKDIFNLF